jgi:hypothetical protein
MENWNDIATKEIWASKEGLVPLFLMWWEAIALPSPKLGPRWASVSNITELWGLEGTLLALSTKRG